MQTAEEIISISIYGHKRDIPKTLFLTELITPDQAIDMMKEYAKQACEEQIYLCYEIYDKAKGNADQIGGIILKSPLPELK